MSKDPYAGSHGVYRKGRGIDGPGGQRFRRVHPDIARALRYRFDGGSASVYAPGRRSSVILHDIENFWDGPSEVSYLGGGELEYVNPYNGAKDRFNVAGYYNASGDIVPWGER